MPTTRELLAEQRRSAEVSENAARIRAGEANRAAARAAVPVEPPAEPPADGEPLRPDEKRSAGGVILP